MATAGDTDHLGVPRLGRAETAFWYGLAGLTYVGFSIFHKWLLNWFVGPMWLVAFAWFGPLLARALQGRARWPFARAGAGAARGPSEDRP